MFLKFMFVCFNASQDYTLCVCVFLGFLVFLAFLRPILCVGVSCVSRVSRVSWISCVSRVSVTCCLYLAMIINDIIMTSSLLTNHIKSWKTHSGTVGALGEKLSGYETSKVLGAG